MIAEAANGRQPDRLCMADICICRLTHSSRYGYYVPSVDSDCRRGTDVTQIQRSQSSVKVAVYDNTALVAAQFFGLIISLLVVLLIIGVT